MKNTYSLYYDLPNLGDVLFISFRPDLVADRYETKGSVLVAYCGDIVCSYNVFDIMKVIKIKNIGHIFFPSSYLVEIINTLLINSKVAPLEVPSNSGYFIAKTLNTIKDGDTFVVETTLGNEKAYGLSKEEIPNGTKVVIAKVGTHLWDDRVVKVEQINEYQITVHICSENDLGEGDEENLFIVKEDIEIGKDFFSMEVK